MIVTNNKIVSIHYHATDKDGNIVDSNVEFAPLEYLHGHNNILAGLEKALEGLKAGQEVQVTLSPAEAYGEYEAGKVKELSLEQFPVDAAQLQPGMTVESSDGLELQITGINEQTVTLDGNHPLAGKVLNFWVKVITVREAMEEELQQGHPLTQQNENCGPGCCC